MNRGQNFILLHIYTYLEKRASRELFQINRKKGIMQFDNYQYCHSLRLNIEKIIATREN